MERLPSLSEDDLCLPELYLGFYDWVLAHDGDTGQSYLISTGLPDGSERRAEEREAEIMDMLASAPVEEPAAAPASRAAELRSNFSRESYMAAVERVKAYLAAGDAYQVNLSQRFQSPYEGDTWSLYLRLREANPAPFAAYLGFPELQVLSASPEEFLRLDGGRVRVRPIKGTRPVGSTDGETAALAAELLASEKERAENVMIVDLIRNDIGRVCRIGSVEVPSLFAVEQHPTVLHLVSTVTGELREGADAIDLPAGVLSGRLGDGRAQGAGHGDNRGAGAGAPRRLLRGHRLRLLQRRHGHEHCHSHAGSRRRTGVPAGGRRHSGRLGAGGRVRGDAAQG